MCCVVTGCVVLWCVVFWCVVKCCDVMCCDVLYCVVLWFVVVCWAVMYCDVMYCDGLCCVAKFVFYIPGLLTLQCCVTFSHIVLCGIWQVKGLTSATELLTFLALSRMLWIIRINADDIVKICVGCWILFYLASGALWAQKPRSYQFLFQIAVNTCSMSLASI